jgi:L-arabinose transport system ATP-binding protein
VLSSAYLQFAGVGKSFPGVKALADVSFDVSEGSVHALLGENGAGKSTLLKILSGVYRPDQGEIRIAGRGVAFSTTIDAIRAGVAVIYQELQLVPHLSVAENVFLGHLPNLGGWVRRSELLDRSRQLMAELGEEIDPRARVSTLPIGQRQVVEVAKALSHDAKVIAFDEPTSSLSSRETERLFETIRRLKSHGRVILYVSHRLDEIFSLCDAATVLRDGKHIETFSTIAGIDRSTLVQRMVGRSIDDIFGYRPRQPGAVRLEVQGLMGPGLDAPCSFEVRAGEIAAIFGLVGAGRTELLKLIYGAERATAGQIRIDGRDATSRSPAQSIRSGIVLCPEDRKKEGIIPIRSVAENLNISGRRHFSPMRFWINFRRERDNAETYVKRLGIRTPTIRQLIMNLSGGNQQKVILARWLCEKIGVILLDEPTRGIDVGAKREIYSIIYELAAQGLAVVMVSSELPEVLGVADRVLVMRQGRLVASMNRSEATQESVLKVALPQGEMVEVS